MIVAAVLLLLAPQKASSPKQLLFQKIVATPTGNNGYEEFLRAADALDDDEYRTLSNAIDQYYTVTGEQENPNIPADLQSKSRMEIERLRAGKFEATLKWIQAGNAKPVRDPRPRMTETDVFPEFAAFKKIARFAASDAKVHFADGDPIGATDILIEQLRFSQNIRSVNLIADLVGIAMQGISLAVIEQHLDGIDENDWNEIVDLAKNQLKSPPFLALALKAEREAQMKGPESIFGPDAIEPFSDIAPDDPSDIGSNIAEQLKALTPADQKKAFSEAGELIGKKIDELVNQLEGPEKAWPVPIEDDRAKPLAHSISDYFTATDIVSCRAEARARTQMRLLAVHGLIQLFRMEHDRLPLNLQELNSPDLIFEPFTNRQLQFENKGATYRLFGQGIGGDARQVELRMRPAPGAKEPDAQDVP